KASRSQESSFPSSTCCSALRSWHLSEVRMYRDDYAAAQARLDAVQNELSHAQNQGAQDKQRIAILTAQLNAARDALTRMGANMPGPYGGHFQFSPRSGAVLTLGIL